MDNVKIRVRVEIVAAGQDEGDGCSGHDVSGVDEEVVAVISAEKAGSIDDMEETLLENAYEVMRRALGRQFTEVSKRGLSTTRCRESR